MGDNEGNSNREQSKHKKNNDMACLDRSYFVDEIHAMGLEENNIQQEGQENCKNDNLHKDLQSASAFQSAIPIFYHPWCFVL